MLRNRTMPDSSIIPVLTYPDVGASIEWLCETFGFRERWRAGNHRAQLAFGNGTVVVTENRAGSEPGGQEGARHLLMVRVDDADSHCEHAKRSGARILHEPADYPYGERQYTVQDPGGHQWMFSQSIADLAPEDWGGTSGGTL
jgi:uncharacterized glyoxalase superfamily protein PhnB